MSKINYSGFISRISGKLDGVIYRTFRGTDCTRAIPASVAQPNTPRQLQIKSNFRILTKAFSALSLNFQLRWEDYAGMVRTLKTGQNAFVRLNANLLNASHDELVCHDSPPRTPSTPKHVRNFQAAAVSSTVTCLTWTNPRDVNTFVTGHFHLHDGFCRRFPSYELCCFEGYRMSWRFVKTERADQRQILHNHVWPTGAELFYQLNSIDKRGRKSPVTHQIQVTVP